MRISRLSAVALLGLVLAGGAGAQSAGGTVAPETYTLCAFYPQGAPCAALYQQVLKNSGPPPALAVKQAFEGYARYLQMPSGAPSPGLTDLDRQYLAAAGMAVPEDLNTANRAGLHNVINDPALAGEVKQRAVSNFIGRARQAELYCHFNGGCGTMQTDKPSGT
jgi:hypothetical protein